MSFDLLILHTHDIRFDHILAAKY